MAFRFKKGIGLLKRLYCEYIHRHRGGFYMVWIFHLLFAATLMAPVYLVKMVIDEGIAGKDLRLIWVLCGAVLGSFLLLAAIDKLRNYFGHVLAQKITYFLRNSLYNKLQRLSFSFYDNTKTGELLSRLIDDLNIAEEIIYHGMENILTNGSTVLFTCVMLFALNWKLAIISLALMPLAAFIGYKISLKMFAAARVERKKKADLASRLEDNLAGIRIIQSFVREPYEMERFDRENRGHYNSRVRVVRHMSWLFPMSVTILGVSLAVSLGYGGYQVVQGTMTVGVLTAFTIYLERFLGPLLALAMISESVTRFLSGIERFFMYMDMKADIEDAEDAVELDSVTGEIEFQAVSFRYDKETILDGINLHIKPGETVALVGPSGAGKTTITRLVPRFYEPFKGRILIDGRDSKKIKPSSLRSHIGMVMQDDYLFSDSLLENIGYGRLDAEEHEILRASVQANVDRFAQELPQGYHTELGPRGVKVSEGQAQRISIARAALKNPPILILDEATSSVDSETEKVIQEALDELTKDKTCIVIAHRLSTILGADKILFIEKGKIAEQGNHRELIAKNAKYAHFYRLQFKEAM